MSFRREARDIAEGGCLLWIIGGMAAILIIGIGVVSTGLHYAAMPWLRQQETAINRSSQGYVEAKQAQLLKNTQDAYRLQDEIIEARNRGADVRSREAHFRATLDVIEREAATIQPHQVPAQTQELMRMYGRAL